MDYSNYVMMEDFLNQIEMVEGFDLRMSCFGSRIPKGANYMIPNYPYTTPMSDDCTTEDFLNERLFPLFKKIIIVTNVFGL